ncbi:hypothetical protein MJ1HA_1750 [Metallosphaera sedula]|nr:hypothetical protein MJ1HA_1750 [Metallosphaera sedula]
MELAIPLKRSLEDLVRERVNFSSEFVNMKISLRMIENFI